MKDVMVISITHHLSLLCPSGSAQAQRVPTPDPSSLVGCANETDPSFLAYCTTKNTAYFFADLSIYGLGSKVALSGVEGGVTPDYIAVVICEALSRYLCFCFLHLLAGFAVRLTTTHPFVELRQDYTRYRGLPSHLLLHPQRTTSQGAMLCEQCLSITSSARILKHVCMYVPIVCIFCMCSHS